VCYKKKRDLDAQTHLLESDQQLSDLDSNFEAGIDANGDSSPNSPGVILLDTGAHLVTPLCSMISTTIRGINKDAAPCKPTKWDTSINCVKRNILSFQSMELSKMRYWSQEPDKSKR
jgi:hypothetical protein